MNVLLTTPLNKICHPRAPDLGLGYLATALRKDGHQVQIFDRYMSKLTIPKFRNYLKEMESLGAIGLKLFSEDITSAKETIAIIKEICPTTAVIVGGPHPSGAPVHTMTAISQADYGFIGESETGLPALIKKIEEGGEISTEMLKKIPGLIWRDNKEVTCNPPKFMEDLDSLGLPSWDLMSPAEYPPDAFNPLCKSFPVAPIITSRGCPYKCTFCSVHTIAGNKVRTRTAESVMREINFLYQKYGVKEFRIVDDNFTFYSNHAKQICEKIIKSGLQIQWACANGVRLDSLDEEILRLMKRAGCYSLSIGIESGSEKILRLIKKGLEIKLIKEKVSLINKVGLQAEGFFMLGFPGENLRDIRETLDLAMCLKINFAAFSICTPFPGTELFESLIKQGEIINIEYDSSGYYKTPHSHIGIPSAQLRRLQKKAFWRFHLRPHIMWNILKHITSLKNLYYITRRVFLYYVK